ncbi:Iron-sulfur cluster biosynthesis family protein [Melia azedarach]|uniref:Iron-sulfur cluster biosynthesis family protein n=1 Tax=Melia azedarach TaxID=155640 RepID=A0ACC1X1S7_MELAZ|nr:Iron-sulfur cluster biosynthesis family protein [Melia azedarach]
MASISTCFTITPKSRFFFTTRPWINLKPPDSSPRIQTLALPRLVGKIPNSRVLVPVVKASSDIAAGVRPGGIVESDKLPSDVRKRTMNAVDACRGRVTIGDVASKAGLKLNEAQKALQALAADTDGFLEVSDEGDVLYVFPKDYRSKLAAKSFMLRVEPFIDKAKAAAEYSIRVLFGTTLIASIVIVFTAIIALLSSKSDDDDRGRRRRSFDSGFNFYISPADLFWYWDPYYYRRRQVRADDDGKMNFIESVFSFVFGEGDPNQGIEEKRWKLIGQYIASHGGVVTAEELAPYLDIDRNVNDESYVLPVLLRFDGQPEIDEEGNILYRFPSLQRTASSQRSGRKEYVGRRWADAVGAVEKVFREKKWQFSKTDMSERGMAIGLGGLNLFGVIILGAMLQESAVTSTGFIKFVVYIFPLLQIYAGSFFAIPVVRWFLNLKKNADIEKRNRTREKYARALESPDLSLRRKLLSARDMAQKTFIGQDRIVYSTDRDLVEQDYESQEWDSRFREIEKSD